MNANFLQTRIRLQKLATILKEITMSCKKDILTGIRLILKYEHGGAPREKVDDI